MINGINILVPCLPSNSLNNVPYVIFIPLVSIINLYFTQIIPNILISTKKTSSRSYEKINFKIFENHYIYTPTLVF